MRALSDALPTGLLAMANPTLQLHFGCGRATPPVSHSHNWPSGRIYKFFVQNWTKKLFFANKDPKNNFDDWMILQKHVLSFKCNDFFKMANLKAISSSATLNACWANHQVCMHHMCTGWAVCIHNVARWAFNVHCVNNRPVFVVPCVLGEHYVCITLALGVHLMTIRYVAVLVDL